MLEDGACDEEDEEDFPEFHCELKSNKLKQGLSKKKERRLLEVQAKGKEELRQK